MQAVQLNKTIPKRLISLFPCFETSLSTMLFECRNVITKPVVTKISKRILKVLNFYQVV